MFFPMSSLSSVSCMFPFLLTKTEDHRETSRKSDRDTEEEWTQTRRRKIHKYVVGDNAHDDNVETMQLPVLEYDGTL